MFAADDPDDMANGIQCKGASPNDDRYSSAWKFSARLGLVRGHARKVWASRLLPLGQYPRMRVQQDDGLVCLLVVAILPKAVVPWHLGPASTPSVRKHSAERMELETYCAWLPAPLRVPIGLLCGPNKGADVTVSRAVPSPGPSFQLTSEQFIHDAGWCDSSGVVSTRTGGALSLFAMNWLQQSSKALWKTLIQKTGTFFFGASNKAYEARTSMLVFLQSFHPRERGDVRSGLFASAPVGLMAVLGRRAYSVTG